MDTRKIAAVKNVFQKNSAVKLAYFFGSRAKGTNGPTSDYDFAVYLDPKITDKKILFDLKLELLKKLSRVLKTDDVDLVVLNTTESPTLKYQVISEGRLIYVEEPYRLLVEPRILNEHFDFQAFRTRHHPIHS